MEKQIYIKPCLKVMFFDAEPVFGKNTMPEIKPDEPGEDLSKENSLDVVWDEDED
jgi:hypothetical protein